MRFVTGRIRSCFATASAALWGALCRSSRASQIPQDRLEDLGDALLDFNGLADLEDWFKANLSPN